VWDNVDDKENYGHTLLVLQVRVLAEIPAIISKTMKLQFILPLFVIVFTYSMLVIKLWFRQPPGQGSAQMDHQRQRREALKKKVGFIFIQLNV